MKTSTLWLHIAIFFLGLFVLMAISSCRSQSGCYITDREYQELTQTNERYMLYLDSVFRAQRTSDTLIINRNRADSTYVKDSVHTSTMMSGDTVFVRTYSNHYYYRQVLMDSTTLQRRAAEYIEQYRQRMQDSIYSSIVDSIASTSETERVVEVQHVPRFIGYLAVVGLAFIIYFLIVFLRRFVELTGIRRKDPES